MHYAFTLEVLIVDNEKRIYHNIDSKAYPMLAHLNKLNASATENVIANLEQLIDGTQMAFGPWGEDFCRIQSDKDLSQVTYYEYSDENYWEGGFTTEIPTPTLLHILRDWLLFLQNNPRADYK